MDNKTKLKKLLLSSDTQSFKFKSRPIYSDYHSKELDNNYIKDDEKAMVVNHYAFKSALNSWWISLTLDEQEIYKISYFTEYNSVKLYLD